MEDSWIIKYERNVCMYELYMNTSIVFISWKVESRVKEANTINNIDNNVIKKDIDNDILNTVNPFWNTINDINNIYWYRFIENIINCRRTFLDKLLLCVHIFIDIFLFFFFRFNIYKWYMTIYENSNEISLFSFLFKEFKEFRVLRSKKNLIFTKLHKR